MKFGALALIGAVSAATMETLIPKVEYEFMGFITEHNRSYATTAEYKFRLAQFSKRAAEVKRWNAIPRQTSL